MLLLLYTDKHKKMNNSLRLRNRQISVFPSVIFSTESLKGFLFVSQVFKRSSYNNQFLRLPGFLLLAVCLSVANSVSAQITAGPVAKKELSNASSVNIPYNNLGGSNQILMVGVSAQQPYASVTTVTYGGKQLTRLDRTESTDQSRVEIWYLMSPSVGNADVAVHNSGSENGIVGVMTFSGVNQSSPFGQTNNAQGSSTKASVSVASASGELVYSVVSFNNGESNLNPGSGQAEHWDGTINSSTTGAGGTKAGAASVNMTWESNSARWTIIATSLKPANNPTTFPGGAPGVAIWLKANQGISNGSTLSWSDQSGKDRHATQSSSFSKPLLTENVFNFNPGFFFDGTDDFLNLQGVSSLPSGKTKVQAFAVASHLNSTGSSWSHIISYGSPAEYQMFGIGKQEFSANATTMMWGEKDAYSTAQEFADNKAVLLDGKYTGSEVVISSYGKQVGIYSGTNKRTTTAGYVGVDIEKASNTYWNGNISEVIFFPDNLSATQVKQVNSYLALKYGITLDQSPSQDYIASDGSTFYWKADSNTEYNKNIAGIVRDDLSGLNQKQSMSVNPGLQVIMGNGGTIAPTNAVNNKDFSEDKSALVWADNGGSIVAWTAEGAPSGRNILPRKWKVQKTGAVNSVRIQVPDGNLDEFAAQTTGKNADLEIKSSASRGQTFKYTTGASTYSVNRLQVYLRKDSDAPGQTITFRIRSSWEGADLATATIKATDLTTTYDWYNLVLSSELPLTKNTVYFIRADNPGTGKLYWGQAGSGSYANGAALTTSGATDGAKDNLFRVLYATPNALPDEDGGSIYLLVDNDGNFTSGANSYKMTLLNGFWETVVSFNNGQYFTFANGCSISVSGDKTDVSSCFGASNGAITLTHQGTGPFTYVWSLSDGAIIPFGANNLKELTNLTAGTYEVKVTDKNECVGLAGFVLYQPEQLSLDAMVTAEFPYSGANGTITLNATGGVTPYKFDWEDISGNNNSKDRTGLSAGVYSVTLTNAKGCTIEKSFEVEAFNLVYKDLYLSDPSQSLDRIDPVASADATTASVNIGKGVNTAIVAASTSKGSSKTVKSGSTLSFAHSPGTGSNRLLLVSVAVGTTFFTSTPGTVTNVTFGGTTMTQVAAEIENSVRTYIYMLQNPTASPSAEVVITIGTRTSSVTASATTFTGVDPNNPLGTPGKYNDNSSSIQGTYSSSTGSLVYSVAAVNGKSIIPFVNQSISIASGQTELWKSSGFDYVSAATSTKPGASSVIVQYNFGYLSYACMIAVSINPTPPLSDNTSFTQAPAICSPLTIKSGQPIFVTAYASVLSGSMPASPAITATLKYGSTNIISLSSPTWNSSTGLLTWTGALNDDMTIPAGQAIRLDFSTSLSGLAFSILYDSQSYPSKVSLPVTTYIKITDFAAYNANYPNGSVITGTGTGTNVYLRATVTDPFGSDDITGLTINLPPSGNAVAITPIATPSCEKVYQYILNTSGLSGSYSMTAIAKEGLENMVTDEEMLSFDVCSPAIGAPVFALGTTSTRCQGTGDAAYTATSANSTGISYSLDADSKAAGNKINSTTGVVTFIAGWQGTSTIAATASGCSGPKTASHTVTTTPSVTVPVFAVGASSERCKKAGTETYTATANNTTGITYSLDAASLSAGNTINANTGVVSYKANWSGQTIITASAAGCNGPATTNHTVTVIGVVAIEDLATGIQSVPLKIDVLANDYCDINPASVTVVTSPVNGFIQTSNDGSLTYLPNGTFFGTDDFTYQVCSNGPNPVCDQAVVKITIEETFNDPCAEATRSKTFYLSFPEDVTLRNALLGAADLNYLSDSIRTVLSIKTIYPGTIIVYDHWEDGYEADISAPTQPSTEIWGDGNPLNGWAPGFPNDIIPTGGYIIVDNPFQYNPRNPSIVAFDGKDKLFSTNDIAVSKITGDAGSGGGSPIFTVQNIKTNVVDDTRFGKLFVLPFGENTTLGGTGAFKYTGLFVRAANNGTIVELDYNGDGTVDKTSPVLNEGDTWFYSGTASIPGNATSDVNKSDDLKSGGVVTSNYPIGVDLLFGGIDHYGTRNLALLPGQFYGNTYYSPVYTTLSDAPVFAFFTNSLEAPVAVNWEAGTGVTGTVIVPAKGANYLSLSQKSGYKFYSEGEESFTAVAVIDADADGAVYDWSFNMIPGSRLTNFASIAWAPGSRDNSGNYNPVWVTAEDATTVYIKYDGNLTSSSGSESPCGFPYDVSIPLSRLQAYRIFDDTDNDQTGIAVYTCDGVKIAAVWGQDPYAKNSLTPTGSPAQDVGYVMEPRCLEQLIIANNDVETTEPETPVIVDILRNDAGFLCTPDPGSVNNDWLLEPSDGSISINHDGTITYTPDAGFEGTDQFEYRLCSVEYPNVCDIATVTIHVTDCFAHTSENLITGKVFVQQLPDNGVYNGEQGAAGSVVVSLYADKNCNGEIDSGENLIQTTVAKASGNYSFSTKNGYGAKDDFDPSATLTGNDGGVNWDNSWTKSGYSSSTNVQILANPLPGSMGNAIRLTGKNCGISRTLTFKSATDAVLKFSYMRQNLNAQKEAVAVKINSTTVFTIDDGILVGTDVNYHNVTIPLSSFNANGANTLQFVTNGNTATGDYFWIDNVELIYFTKPACYIVKLDNNSIGVAYSASSLNTQAAVFNGIGVCDNHNYLGILVNVDAVDDIVVVNKDMATQIKVLNNDIVAKPDFSSLEITASPSHGTVVVNADGTTTYTPNMGYIGTDQYNYKICSIEDPSVCDIATVYITISCLITEGFNNINGMVYFDENLNGVFENGEKGAPGIAVQLYSDTNGNGVLNPGEPLLSTKATNSVGAYQFNQPSAKGTVLDKFNTNGSGNGNDGTVNWAAPWAEIKESNGFNTGNVMVTGNQLLITGREYGASRKANLSGANLAILSFDYEKTGFSGGNNSRNLSIQVSTTGSDPWNTLDLLKSPNGSGSASYDISNYASANTAIRFITNSSGSAGTFYLDNIQIEYVEKVSYIVKLATPLPTGMDQSSTPLSYPIAFNLSDESACSKNFGLISADVAIQKTSAFETVPAGDSIIYTLAVTNNGPTNAANVVVTDVLPQGLTLLSAIPEVGTWSAPTWNIGLLQPKQKVNMTIIAKTDIELPSETVISNTATVVSSTPDKDLTNNQSTATNRVICQPVNIIIETPETACEGVPLNLSATGEGIYSWHWTGPDGFTSDIRNPQIPALTRGGEGLYRVTATTVNGCTASEDLSLTVIPLPGIQIDGDPVICLNHSTLISASASGGEEPYSFQWDNELDAGPEHYVTLTQTTTFKVTVTSGSGCTNTAQFTVEAEPCVEDCSNGIDDDGDGFVDCADSDCIPEAEAGSDVNICLGDAIGISASGTTGGTPPYSYTWSHGLGEGQDQEVSPEVTTTYYVTVTSASGCSSVDSVIVAIIPCPEICGDGIDNDGDGLLDCDDPDCRMVGAPQPKWDSYIACPGEPLQEQVIFNDKNLQSPLFSIATAPAKGSVTINNQGVFIYTPNAFDCSGDSFVYEVCNQFSGCCDTASVFLIFDDNVPPSIANLPGNITISCDDNIPSPPLVFGLDACPGIYISFEEQSTKENGACSNYTITRTWTATDLCGNANTESRTITVEDASSPKILRVYTLSNDKKLVAGVSDMVSHNWKSVKFPRKFTEKPLVFSQVISDEESSAVVVRMRNISKEGFEMRLSEQEAADDLHLGEQVAWMAVEPGNLNDTTKLQANLITGVNSDYKTISFTPPYVGSSPVFIASVQTNNDKDPIAVRYADLSASSVNIRLEEETSKDIETVHGIENLAYLSLRAGKLSDKDQEVFGETGKVNLTESWQTVELDREYTRPVVLFGGLQAVGGAATIRVRNVTGNSFEVQVKKWDYLTGAHPATPADFVVVEASVPADTLYYNANGVSLLTPGVSLFAIDNCTNQVTLQYDEEDSIESDGMFTTRNWFSVDDCGNVVSIFRSNTRPIAALRLKAILAGAMIGNGNNHLMRDDLRKSGLIPLSEPYSAMPSFHHKGDGGNEIMSPSMPGVEGSNAVVDWVFVEIRKANQPDMVVATCSALLLRNGDVATSRGDSVLLFPTLDAGNYFVAIRHRNHLGAMTNKEVFLSLNQPPLVDFRDEALAVYGGSTAGVLTSFSERALWAGDLNSDRKVIYQGPNNDIFYMFSKVLLAPGNQDNLANFILKGYFAADLNLDGQVIYQGPNNDRSLLLFYTTLSHPENIIKLANFIVQEKLP